MKLLVLIALAGFTSFSYADIFEPFTTSNLNPFVQVQGLPATQSAVTQRRGEFAWNLQSEFANNFTRSASGAEAIAIDGETWRTTLVLRYGIGDRWELGLTVPYLRHTGGSLDNFIENWHKIWGLPNGNRDRLPQDRLDYRYRVGATDLVNRRRSVSGIGDVQVSAGIRLRESELQTLTLRGGVKLATGDSDDLLGSDGTATWAGIYLTRTQVFGRDNWQFHGHLGALAPGSGDILDEQREDLVVFGSTTLAWSPRDRISLKAQLDFHSAFYDSDLRELGDPSAQLSLGGSVRLTDKLLLDLAVSEDVVTDTAPDVVLQIGLRSRF